MADITQSPFVHKINNDYYWFRVTLYAANNTYQDITPTAIKSFVLEDSYDDFYHKGYIVIDNKYDVIERSITPVTDTQGQVQQQNAFLLMGDGRDFINIEIMPVGGTQNVSSWKDQTLIYLQATIYNSEDLPSDTPDVKFKKLYFRDKYFEYLSELNVQWSTSDVVQKEISNNTLQPANLNNLSNKNIINFSDKQREIPTGQAIKEFLAASLKPTSYEALFPAADFTQTSTTTTATTMNTNDPYWDAGQSTIFFSTPAKFKALDSLSYLMNHHVSSDASLGQSFLRLDRANRCFTLTPISNIFNNAVNGNTGGNLYIETVLLGGLSENSTALTSIITQQSDFVPTQSAIQLADAGTTKNFTLDPSVGEITRKEIGSKFVHSYDYTDKQFNVDVALNSVINVFGSIYRSYVKPVKNSSWVSIVPGQLRAANYNVEHVFSNIDDDPIKRLTTGLHKSLYANIFGNNQIKFNIQGFTARQAGKFIGISREGSSPVNQFDQKYLGVYFITNVKHIFEGNAYRNEVTCIKTYTEVDVYNAGQISSPNPVDQMAKQVIK